MYSALSCQRIIMYLHVYIAEGTVDIAVVDLLKRKHSPMPDVTDTDTQSNSNFD